MSEPMTDRNRAIFRKAVVEKKSQAEIGREYGISSPRVSQIIQHVGREMYGETCSLEELRKRAAEAAAETGADLEDAEATTA